MNAKKGRKSAYESVIKPNLENIKEWAKKGATDLDIARKLGIGKTTYFKYKAEFAEFTNSLKDGRAEAVEQLETAMFDSAIGGTQTLKKAQKVKKILYADGKKDKEVEVMEAYEEEIYIPPNVTAGIFLLKHWAKDKGYTNDPMQLELKREELEHKIEMDKLEKW